MSFSISISGHVTNPDTAEAEEQKLVDDLKALIATHGDKVSYASGSFQYQGSVDLMPVVAVVTPDPAPNADGSPGEPGTPPAPPEPDTPPEGFFVKIAGETYADYAARAAAVGITTILDEAAWNALAPDGTPGTGDVTPPDGTPPADNVTPPFVQKMSATETYAEAQRRLFIFNEAQPTVDTQAPAPSETEWDALPVG